MRYTPFNRTTLSAVPHLLPSIRTVEYTMFLPLCHSVLCIQYLSIDRVLQPQFAILNPQMHVSFILLGPLFKHLNSDTIRNLPSGSVDPRLIHACNLSWAISQSTACPESFHD